MVLSIPNTNNFQTDLYNSKKISIKENNKTGISTSPGLFYAEWLGNQVRYTFISSIIGS